MNNVHYSGGGFFCQVLLEKILSVLLVQCVFSAGHFSCRDDSESLARNPDARYRQSLPFIASNHQGKPPSCPILTADHPRCLISSRLALKMSSFDVTTVFIRSPQYEFYEMRLIYVKEMILNHLPEILMPDTDSPCHSTDRCP